MSELDRIVTVNISRQTASVSQAGFGTMLLLAAEADKPGSLTTRVGVYDSESYKTDYAAGTLTREALDDHFSADVKPTKVYVGFIEGAETVTEALDAVAGENNDWYALALTTRTKADQLLAAAWVQTAGKIDGLASDDTEMLNPASVGDLAKDLSDLGYSRSFSQFNEKANVTDKAYPECAWMGAVLPYEPGSITWAYKNLPGQVPSVLSGTQRTALEDKSSNWYNELGGVDVTETGVMADGSWIDEIRSVDWLKARTQEAIFGRLVNSKKIPYTDDGVAIIVAEVEKVLQLAEDQGILAPGEWSVTAPKVADVPTNDRANRLLPNVNFTARLAGAIHNVIVNGVVTV